jgi:hypothetical protein
MLAIHPRSVTDYLARVGAEVLNFRRAIVKIHKGHYYIERAIIRLYPDGKVTCSLKEFAPTEEEAKAMAADLLEVEFPHSIQARNTDDLKHLVKGEIYEFIDRETGHIIMAQERREDKATGTKRYIPWTLMSDGKWEPMEPDGGLPFWKPAVGLGAGAKVMIHEGAKAAAFITDLLADGKDHPWAESLRDYEHWGMIGGALAPHRTDYEELSKIKPTSVVYACDNDKPGESALQKVSKAWGHSMKGLVFGSAFPSTWDMADPVPKKLFTRSGRYAGPTLESLLVAATWATELVPPAGGKGRPVAVMRSEFAEEWWHCISPEVFVHKEWPNRMLSLGEFDSQVKPFSHVSNTSSLLKGDFSSKAAVLKYVPGSDSGIYSGSDQGRYINTYRGPAIRPEVGDAAPWLQFMEGLIPDEGERHEVLRWVATLIARPDVRMLYGLLLISETQGIGKGTLGEKILAPLVGFENVSYPSESDIVESAFNGWLAHKRLAVVHEIYAGHSSKAYDKMKSVITDRFTEVNIKYQKTYTIENWIHVVACSNSLRALKISMDDRRWYVPRLTEIKRSAAYWEGLNAWLTQDGGLSIILQWARDFLAGDADRVVLWGAPAPASAAKAAMVKEGYSPGQLIVDRALSQVRELIEGGQLPVTTFVTDQDLIALIKNELYEGRHNEKLERPLTARNVAKASGWLVGDKQAQVKAWGPERMGARIITLNPEIAAKTPGELGGVDVPEVQRLRPLDFASINAM